MSTPLQSGRQLERARTRSSAGPWTGWHPYRPYGGLQVPDWAVELAFTIELSSSWDRRSLGSSALLLVRSTSRWQRLVQSVSAAAAEVEALAGVAPRVPVLRVVQADPRPGLEPVRGLDAFAHLRRAAERGHAGRPGQRQASGLGISRWEPGPGAVLTCDGPAGTSAQAVVALAGRGDPQAIRPPGGGAVVLRAWRTQRAGPPAGGPHRGSVAAWALALGVVLASPAGRGLGRAARRYAANAEVAGWTATVLTGVGALNVAIAGDPRHPAPSTAARVVPVGTVNHVLAACLEGAADPATHPRLAAGQRVRPAPPAATSAGPQSREKNP
jgi:hypothetical protein